YLCQNPTYFFVKKLQKLLTFTTIKYLHFFFLYSAISKIVFIASSFAGSINPQVLITITSASFGLFTISYLFALKIPIVFSVSTKFLLHPNDTNPTFIFAP